jgi:alkanesulfonate monooxygenase SsuD/methylene tetrahydromethanopterin reductase-like flavin-dependent oxidoreductase (luciferase family)
MPAGIGPAAVAAGRQALDAMAVTAGRQPSDIITAPQVVVSLGATHSEAVATFEASQLFKHLVSLRDSTLRDSDMSRLTEGNLVGTPDEVCARVTEYARAGVTHLSGLLFVGNTVDELLRGARWFAQDVISGFAEA